MTRWLVAALSLIALHCSSSDSSPRSDIAVRVSAIAYDETAETPVMILEEEGGNRQLPIWIGLSEARSIAAQIGDEHGPRPNAHDLARQMIRDLDLSVERVVVTELRDNVYYARLVLSDAGRLIEIDARPSDAIAIGLRVEAPLFVREEVFFSSASEDPVDEQVAL